MLALKLPVGGRRGAGQNNITNLGEFDPVFAAASFNTNGHRRVSSLNFFLKIASTEDRRRTRPIATVAEEFWSGRGVENLCG